MLVLIQTVVSYENIVMDKLWQDLAEWQYFIVQPGYNYYA